jgi:hypothetical protein
MPDQLHARDADGYLSPWGVVNRLKSTFSYVESDGEQGRLHVIEMINSLRGNASSRRADAQLAEQLERVKNHALLVYFGDDPGAELAVLTTYVVPGRPLVFEYSSHAQEQAAQPLLTRCAAALDYEIVRDRRTVNDPEYRGRDKRRFPDRRTGTDRRKG